MALGVPATGLWPGAAHGQPDTASAEVVSLEFGWPVGLTARVEATRVRERRSEEGTDSSRVDLSYRLTLAAHESDLLVRYDSIRFPQLNLAPSLGLAGSAQLLSERLALMAPSYVVGRDGQFRRLEDVAGLRLQVEGLLNGLLGERLEEFPDSARRFIQSLLSEEMLTANALHEWNALVGTWIGAELEIGAVYELETEEQYPILPGRLVPTIHQFLLAGRVACFEGAVEAKCVELQVVTFPDPKVFADLIEGWMDRSGIIPQANMPSFEELEIENGATLIAEPRTLIPHSLELVKSLEGRVREGDKVQPFAQVDVRWYRYRYE